MAGPLPTLAIVGGTGALGGGLARRWAAKGYPIVIGSRSAEKAAAAARALEAEGVTGGCRGLDNAGAAAAGDIVVVTVPYGAHQATLADIKASVAGKIVVDTTVPLKPPKVARAQLPPEGSAAQAAQDFLGEAVQVVSALHNVAAHTLATGAEIDCDVLVCGDDKDARAEIATLARAAGLRAWEAGPLANSVAAESLTPVLIAINRRYKIPGSGIRITGGSPDDG